MLRTACQFDTMASTVQERTSSDLTHYISRSSSDSDISPRRTSPSPSRSRQRTISFSEDTHSSRCSPSRSGDPSNHEAAESRPNEECQVGAQEHDRDLSRQSNFPTLDRPSSDSSGSNSSQDLKKPWYRSLASNYRSISLENTGSVARDHLALERTFLAWLRTSLAFASIGIAITQLFRLNTSFIEQKPHPRRRDHTYLLNGKDEAGGDLPLSLLVGASLNPEIYTHIQSALQQQTYPIPSPLENSASTLLGHLLPLLLQHQQQQEQQQQQQQHYLQPAASDSGSAARLRHLGKPLGATFLGISIVILFVGFHRYFESQHWIIRGQFPASRGSVALVGAIAVALIVASLVVVLVVAPNAHTT